jgi:hypothetical protein
MNKIIFLFLLTLSVNIFSQYSIPFRLVQSNGTPRTGEASDVVWTKYPHSFGTDNISGLTTVEVGTAGNYRTYGFSTYQYARLWVDGVLQSWLDSIITGDITAYILSNYISKTTTQTGISGTKSLTGDWVYTNGTQTLFKPYVSNSNPWLTDYSLLTNTMLTPKVINDSLYGNGGKFFYTGGKLYLHSGIKLYGTGGTQPIQINTTQFDWDATDGLELDNPVQFDSVTIKEDTTISESNYSKIWSIHRNHWSEIDSMRLWMTYYNTLANTRDSFQVINNVSSVDNETSVSLLYDGTASKIDSVYLQVGVYMIDFGMMWERPDHNDIAQIEISDTIIVALKESGSAPNTYLVNNIRDIETYHDENNLSGSELSWSTTVTITSPKYVYLYGKYFATALSNALGLGATASIKRGRIIATLIK